MGEANLTVFIDAMGGDFAPRVIVRGAVQALAETNAELVLVGDRARIEPLIAIELRRQHLSPTSQIRIEHTSEYIEMGEHPSAAVRRKKDASLNVAMRLTSESSGAAFLSAGNSGAALASSVMYMRRIKGVERPAIAATVPGLDNFFLLVDAGANTQCRPSQLAQFALLGSTFYRYYFPGSRGTIGLLSNGGEESKGTDLTRETSDLLKKIEQDGLLGKGTYRGYVEGSNIFRGAADVVVCDGFAGNIFLKGIEGLAKAMLDLVKREVEHDILAKMGLWMASGSLRKIKARMDYAEVGGAPLIGVNGHAFIAHGSSPPKAIKNAILKAVRAAASDMPQALSEIIQRTKPYLQPASNEEKEST